MFACLDALIYEVIFYKPEKLAEKNKARRSKARQKIREQRKQSKTDTKQIVTESQKRAEEIATQRQRETRTTKQVSSQHTHQ